MIKMRKLRGNQKYPLEVMELSITKERMFVKLRRSYVYVIC